MRMWVVLVDLSKDSRRVIDHFHLPRKQTAWPAPQRADGLHRSLAERTCTDERRAPVILQSPGDDFGGRVAKPRIGYGLVVDLWCGS